MAPAAQAVRNQEILKDALWDIKSTKKYILDTFKYREYAENFSKKIKKAIKELDSFQGNIPSQMGH